MSTTGRIEYSELVDIPSLQALMERFSQVIGIANAVIDVDGNVIAHAGWQEACTGFHRVNAETCLRCHESDTSLVESMTQGAPYAIYRCHNGLVDTAAPIIVDGEHVANVFSGQFLTETPDLGFFRQQAQQFGFDTARYLAAIAKVPVVPQARIESITRLYAQLASTLADNGLDRLRQRKTAQDLASLNLQLEDKIVARTQSLGIANQDLAGREALLKQILDTSSVAIFLIDKEGRITQANQRMAEMFRRPLDELVGSEYATLVRPAEREVERQKVHALLVSSTPTVDLERLYWRADQSEFCGHLTGKRFLNANGEECGLVGVIADITERKQAENALNESESRLRTIIENEPECIKIIDEQGLLIQMNSAGLAMVEADSLEQVAGHPVLDLIAPEHREAYADLHKRVIAGEPMQMEYEVIGLKGGRSCLETHAVPMLDNGKVVHLAVTRDITERKQAEDALRQERDQNQRYLDTTLALMVELDGDGNVVMVNRAAQKLLGYTAEELLGRNWFETCLPQPEGMDRVFPVFLRVMAGDIKSVEENENAILRRDGSQRQIVWHNTYVRNADGQIVGTLSSGMDITVRKEHERQLEHIAHYDALTTLPNRVLLSDRLMQALAQAQRRGQRLAVAYLDLDGFKAINDIHGHEAGDKLLIALASRMKQALREGDTLARLGGDEFVAVLFDLIDVEASVLLLTRLLTAAADPVHIDDLLIQVSASIGVTFYPQAEDVDADQLLRQADQAMYQAKLAGKNRYHVFDAEQDRNVRGHHESLEHIRRALNEHEFVLYYQPKVNMRTGTIIGAEALIRWQHPEKGLLPPAVFLPVIEDHPLAIELGEWVIDNALTQMEIWHAAGLDIPVSVNVGARQLQQANFSARLRTQLAAHPEIMPCRLELEVLETSALEDLAQISRIIEECREIGVMFALDDFGTGYSSLTYLKRLPVTLLKIDQSFVRGMLHDPDDLAILEGVLGMSTAFRRQVIAEGVETVEHGAMLLQLGCEQAQGYGIAHPMPAQELLGWSLVWRTDLSWANLPAVSRDDLPLLYAGVEHRAWIVRVENCLKSERETPPPLDRHLCRFGTWLDADGLLRHGTHPAFLAIESLHRNVHELAAELCGLKAQGRDQEALSRLGELHELRDALLGHLKMLVRESRP